MRGGFIFAFFTALAVYLMSCFKYTTMKRKTQGDANETLGFLTISIHYKEFSGKLSKENEQKNMPTER
jgi:hypothetical protein